MGRESSWGAQPIPVESVIKMQRRIWFHRTFELGIPIEAFPEIVERLRGTPLRLRERTSEVPDGRLTQRRDGGWSIQEHVGHLVDLEALWAGRLDDFNENRDELRPADVENRATWEGHHNEGSLEELLEEFATLRATMLRRCEVLDDQELARTAFHPRLRQPMAVVDLLFFVAEHDDHHLASITELSRQLG